MQCQQCAFTNPPGMAFCGGCGKPLGVCPQCGEKSTPGFKFCGHCGADLGSSGVASSAGSSQASQHQPATSDEGGESAGPASPSPVAGDAAERRQITVMFCDLVGSTALSERVDPEELREILRSYHEIADQIVRGYDGHIAQYLGDGVLVYFGYPRAHEDDAQCAVQSGLEIVHAVNRLAISSVDPEISGLAVRVGIHTGPVVAGEVGTGGATERLALGPTPNIAARVQGLAEPGEVVLTAATQALIASSIRCSSLGLRRLKGVSREIEVFTADGLAQEDEQGYSTPFIGRSQELGSLMERARLVTEGEGQVSLLRGEAGIGKSRLQRELRKKIGAQFHRWITARCSAHHQNTMLFPLIELIERLAGVSPTESSEDRKERLEHWIPEHLEETEASILREVLALVAGPPRAVGPRQRRQRLEALLEALVAGAEGPVVLVIEDLHWADPSTLDFVEVALERARTLSLFLICSARPSFQPAWRPRDHELRIDLPRFHDSDSRALIRAIWDPPPELEKKLLERSDGVPLFLEEITQAMSGTADESERLIPLTLRDSLMARLDSVGEAREVALLGAVLGRRFSSDLLQAMSPLSAEQLLGSLARLVESGLLTKQGQEPGAIYIFKHALLQDLAYDSLLFSRRRQLHGHVASLLESQFPQLVENQPEVLARHLEGADDRHGAYEAYLNAGTHSVMRSAYVEAIRSYERALALLDHQDFDDSRQSAELRALYLLTAPTGASCGYGSLELGSLTDRIMELVQNVEDPEQKLGYLESAWGSQCARGEPQATRSTAKLVGELAAQSDDPAFQLRASWVQGCTAFYAGDLDTALTLLDHACRGSQFLARLIRAWALTVAGRFSESLESIQSVIDSVDPNERPFEYAQALCHLVVIKQDLKLDVPGVEQLGQQIIQISQEHDMPTWVAYGELALHWGRAKRAMPSGIEDYQAAFDRCYPNPEVTIPHSLILIADCFVTLGQLSEAMQTVDRALEYSASSLAVYFEPEAKRIKGDLLCRGGDSEHGLQWLEEGLQQSRDQGTGLHEVNLLVTLLEHAQDSSRQRQWTNDLRQIIGSQPVEQNIPVLKRARQLVQSEN